MKKIIPKIKPLQLIGNVCELLNLINSHDFLIDTDNA
jgi:hypothetical protein